MVFRLCYLSQICNDLKWQSQVRSSQTGLELQTTLSRHKTYKKYVRHYIIINDIFQQMSLATASLYITVLTTISTLVSMYGSSVIHQAVAPYLLHFRSTVKFTSIQLVLVLSNIQGLVFAILVSNNIPPCTSTRGPLVRSSSKHDILIDCTACYIKLAFECVSKRVLYV